MPGDPQLRKALEEATRLRIPEEYRARLSALKKESHHSVEILPGKISELIWFNCFAYALGVSAETRYLARAREHRDSALIDSEFVADMLGRGEFVEVEVGDVKPNDIVLYFAGDSLKHAGGIHSVAPHLVVRSKWGGDQVHEHPLWEVPAGYGDRVRYFRRPAPALVLERLEVEYSPKAE